MKGSTEPLLTPFPGEGGWWLYYVLIWTVCHVLDWYSARTSDVPSEVVNMLIFMEDYLSYSQLERKVSSNSVK